MLQLGKNAGHADDKMAAGKMWVGTQIGLTELLITHCFAVVVWQLIGTMRL